MGIFGYEDSNGAVFYLFKQFLIDLSLSSHKIDFAKPVSRMGDRILMKLNVLKNVMSQMLYFQFGSDPWTLGAGGGKRKSEISEKA